MIGNAVVVDAAAHPTVHHSDELREFMRPPWQALPFPGPEEYSYTWPGGEYLGGNTSGADLPGSDPDAFLRDLVHEAGVDAIVLLPLTRGLLPDADLDAEICAATNRWLVQRWLDGPANAAGHFFGSIRVSLADPMRAAREIHEWAGHPRMVQVAVRLQALAPYGQRQYLPVWQAAVDHDLPIAVHTDGGSSIGFAPTPVGQVTNALQFWSLYPWNFAYHLASFVAEGVFDRLPTLRVIFADGGFDALAPLVWRLDKDWRPNRVAMPWSKQLPSRYLRDHVRFCAHAQELAADADRVEVHPGATRDLLLYASNYPKWDTLRPADLAAGLTADEVDWVLGGNAVSLLDLPTQVPGREETV